MSVSAEHCAREITRQSRSNLAFAFRCLPAQIRRDMTTFYAFCRVVDDLADEPDAPRSERQAGLDHWKLIVAAQTKPRSRFEEDLQELQSRLRLGPEHFLDIIRGMEMDLQGRTYASYEELEEYCYCAASAVGLISIQIFGCTHPDARAYAIELGHALQLTNILRDVKEDVLREGRMYLPEQARIHHGVSAHDFQRDSESPGLKQLLRQHAALAWKRFETARTLLPAQDRSALRASELMRKTYSALLQKMEKDDFQVLKQRYRLSKAEKIWLLLQAFLPV